MNKPDYGHKPIRTEQTGTPINLCRQCGKPTEDKYEVFCSMSCFYRFHSHGQPPTASQSVPISLIEDILTMSEPAAVKLNKIANLLKHKL